MTTALLVGLGRIGWMGFEEYGSVPTHGSTLMAMRGPRIFLAAGVDTDAKRRLIFQEATQLRVYASMTDALHDEQPSIVTIATPPETHRDLVLEAAAFPSVKGIVCEKPLAPTVAACREITAACEKFHKVLLVDHQRRYERNHLLAAHFIKSGALGKVLAASAVFPATDGGWLNNGSHAADTMRMLAGDAPASMQPVGVNMFQVTCICENGRLTIDSYGKLHSGYLEAMYANMLECLETGATPQCSGEDGLEAVRMTLQAQEAHEAAA